MVHQPVHRRHGHRSGAPDDAPGPLPAHVAIGAGKLADPVAAQEQIQPVVMQPHREQLLVGKADGRRGTEMLEFLLVAPLPGGIEGAEHLSEQHAVFGGLPLIAAAAQDQLLLQPPFHIVLRVLDNAVLMGHTTVVPA